jgi:outer membrane protein OmpA-like peptidoglycan-associated protein
MEKVTLKAGALFDTGRADLKPAGQRELDELAARLKTMQGIDSVQITGHTDSQGQAASNQGLSERRAEAVKAYLVGKGVDGQRISTRGLGASSPVASNATAEGRARNRRVELEIKATQQAP